MADLPIIDAHHHIWRQADLPWLMGPMQPRIFGPYEPLQRDYPIDEFLGDIAGHRTRHKARVDRPRTACRSRLHPRPRIHHSDRLPH